MKPIPPSALAWLLAGALVQVATPAPAQQPKVKELVSLPGERVGAGLDAPWGIAMLPNGRALLYTKSGTGGEDDLVAYDLATKRGTSIARGTFSEITVSRQGDRIAFGRFDPDGSSEHIWTMPIDRVTAVPTGPGQRVSLSQGQTPVFSPDGKFVAFQLYRDTVTYAKFDLAVVAATGGPEHILASNYDTRMLPSWSDDGRWVIIRHRRIGLPGAWTERVPLKGGKSERILTMPDAYDYSSAGAAGRLGLYYPDRSALSAGRLHYLTASGERGEIKVPRGSNLAGWSVDGTRALLFTVAESKTLRTLSLADGKLHELLPPNVQARHPAWSSDGVRLAVETTNGSGAELTVLNPDGSVQRRYPVTEEPDDYMLKWSPDGRSIQFRDQNRRLVSLDLTSGRTSVLTSPALSVDDWTWRPDGKSLVVSTYVAAIESHPIEQRDIYEVQLGGKESKLRDISAEFPKVRGALLLSDQMLVTGTATETVVVPAGAGPSRKLASGGLNAFPVLSADGRHLLQRARWQNGVPPQAELAPISGDSVRRLALPFPAEGGWPQPVFLPDGRNILMVLRTPGEMPQDIIYKIFLVPLNGDAPHALVTLPGNPRGNQFALSPDGRNLILLYNGVPSSAILELDIRALVGRARAAP